jgi:predicted nucleic acid-binding Zn ribbon protein
MRYSDWKMISTFGFILSGISLIGGLITYGYFVTYGGAFGLAIRDYPYRENAVPLFLVVAVLLVVGVVAGQRGKEEIYFGKQKPITKWDYCPVCGTMRDIGDQYCKRCCKKFK